MAIKDYTDIKITKLPDQEVEITGAIPAEKMTSLRKKAIESIQKDLTIDGFRSGHAPEAQVISRVGEMKILEEAGDMALNEAYQKILVEEKIDAIGKPEVTITKIGVGNAMEFKIKTALMPEVKLGDYEKIAEKIYSEKEKEVEISDKEIDDVIQTIRKNMAHQAMHTKGEHSHDDHSHGEIKDEDLPPLDEHFLKAVGNFETIDALKDAVRTNLTQEKTIKNKDIKRTTTLEKIIETSTILLPQIIIEGELEKMKAQFQDDLARSGIKYEDYLTHIKKTEVDLKADWKESAVKRAQSQIILNTIAREQGIQADEERVKAEMEYILSQHKDADRFRVRMYVETFLVNDLVFAFLEGKNK